MYKILIFFVAFTLNSFTKPLCGQEVVKSVPKVKQNSSFVLFDNHLGKLPDRRHLTFFEGTWTPVIPAASPSAEQLANLKRISEASDIELETLVGEMFPDKAPEHLGVSSIRLTKNNNVAIGDVTWNSDQERFAIFNRTWNATKLNDKFLLGAGDAKGKLTLLVDHSPALGQMTFYEFNYGTFKKGFDKGLIDGRLVKAFNGDALVVVVNPKLNLFLDSLDGNEIREAKSFRLFRRKK